MIAVTAAAAHVFIVLFVIRFLPRLGCLSSRLPISARQEAGYGDVRVQLLPSQPTSPRLDLDAASLCWRGPLKPRKPDDRHADNPAVGERDYHHVGVELDG